jgi:hypothetical protein
MAYKYRSGVRAETTRNLLIGPGAIFKGFVDPANFGSLLGATSGGNTVRLETEWHVAEIDGTLGPLKGGRWLTAANAQLETNLIEMTKENFIMKYPSFGATTFNADYTKLSHNGDIAPSSYDTIAVVGEITGKDLPIIFVLENAAVIDAVEVPLGDGKSDVVLQAQWEGHYDPAEPTRIPFYILYPEAGSPITAPTAYDDVTGLAASNVTATTMDLSWTNPTDPDFTGVDIIVNGALVQSNLLASTYQLTGLTASTSYTIEVIARYTTGVANGAIITKSTTA